MKKQLIAITLGATALLWSNNALSYWGPNDHSGMNQGNAGNTVSSEAKGAGCSPAIARLTMDFNDVSAFIEQGGSMFQNRQDGTAAYEIPKGSGLKAIFAGALWMGGTDVNGQLKLAALRYRAGNDFWAGPLSVNPSSGNYNPNQPVGDDAIRPFGGATINSEVCIAYDKFYTIRKAEVIQYTIWWECTNGVTTEGCEEVVQPSADILNRIYDWPAHGRTDLGQDFYLAPFYDRDGDGAYHPLEQGDTPWFDDILGRDDIICGIDRRISLFGDECNWWVFNDKGSIHTETGGDPIGMEIRAQAFAFATTDDVNRMTFYNYELINRGTQTLFETYFSQYLDADIGNFNDDYAGCDVSRGLGYMFNGDLNDETNGAPGYGDNPPAIGVDFFEGPYQDADMKDNVGPYFDTIADSIVTPTVLEAIEDGGIVYQGIGVGYHDGIIDNERYGMRGFAYYTSTAAGTQSDPTSAAQYYNYMQGFWRFGDETYYGGTGFAGSAGATSIPSDYMFPGDSDPLNWATAGTDPGFEWDEATDNNPAGDRRFVQSAGPFTLTPGAVNNITVGIVYGRGTEGSLFASVDAMKRADTKAQALFDACFAILTPPDAPKLTIQELENQLVLTLENPVTSNNYLEGYAEEDKVNITDPTVDRVYTFEGYQIFQLVDDAAGVADLNDPEKARPVAQCDIENSIDRLINFEFDDDLGFASPDEKVDGENKGIRHSFLITEDAFALGERALVNHKTYYFVAVAYAHNEFKKYDPTDALSLDGQKIPYISSRLSFDGTSIRSVEAVPHNPTPEADGTSQNIEYGSSPRITRLDGFGNGGNDLELTQASKDFIVANGVMEAPTYEYGRGPLNIKVIDPLNVADGYFECIFRDYTIPVTYNDADNASWTIYRYDEQGGSLIDEVSSEFIIEYNNEQLIPQWGISVQIQQKPYFITSLGGIVERYSTDLIRADISFADSSKRWLDGVQDNDQFYPTNWVRSGDYTPETDPTDPAYECDPNVLSYLDPCSYADQAGGDNDREFSSILDGVIAPHKLVGYQADYMPIAYYNLTTIASVKNSSSISYLPGVDIVFTQDRSKWTRCPVIELGRDANLNVGGAEPGQMRKSSSLNRDGSIDPSSDGMSWFPGYAIDVESGVRLYMAFGENSFLGNENGADMMWNPTDRLVDGVGNPIMGGMHPVYIWGYKYKSIHGDPFGSAVDFPAYIPNDADNNAGNELYNQFQLIDANNTAAKKFVYASLAWVSYPMATAGYDITNSFPTDVEIELRVNKEYKNYVATGQNGGRPMYSWSMDDIATTTGSIDQLAKALEMINVVPNPYYAYSEYERTRLDTRVKITNLPERCTVKIYSVNGKLIRTFKKDSPVTSIDWDLNNWKAIPVAGGVYLIHVDIPDVGERVLKFFGGMRQVDLQGI
ncbi:MAG: T9SS type A sorting domain-containing protein [Crocinitomicaceae bacterium]|nr:T9SS type A sorting domain-containing protein [Flavobacteriales bacterium]NQZ37307.1 T9SS type A sorting domain-containing protein [Crocinitomicaceae bacterium]